MRVMLRAPKITLEGIETAKSTIKDLRGTIVYQRQDSRPGGGVIANLIVEGERTAIGGILDLIPVEQLGGFTEFGPAATMTGNVVYRIAIPDDEVGILLVFAEVAREVPTAVRPQTTAYIARYVASGQSLIAVDAHGNIVGYALAEPHDKETLSLVYLGVSKAARGQHVSSALISKLKEIGAPIITDVRSDNKSSMVERFRRFGFVETDSDGNRTKLRWEMSPTPEGDSRLTKV
ncbi:GNAT family N-acetyltransferase [Bradyrhizobium liaoningense]|uniref:GNAT family N-acetyltransferase n=1 Tax=Bradyrhizobium liaoningense TaxID=43992 RepID=UPI001BAD8A7D|nr:GNAT family N-acetyltransferase [Bradyrhizobium liaoningense]MBR0710142.1 GNAT family N-acetyltransferase [Bradyrhizobium liaoningense]